MDLEIGFINDEFDIMNLEEDLIKFILKLQKILRILYVISIEYL